ncbi:alkaline phosphatase PhoX [Paenibacillus sediminis]|uniref:Secreted PhoX family phosphatase n=1 Tax=Paenibacillus sediminis TaxID=664909 RepID=A0ABS4H2I2_9BACL|nr:alkaline phosphatase PhoX [Paenibacillus sediminis]MBP1936744.1 secreted PhoX family phosphatase [Paenibacillus sediminis]
MKKKNKSKWLVPVLGLALLAPTVLPTSASATPAKKVTSVEFVGMPAPATAQDMARVYSGASVKVTYDDGTIKSFPLTYKTLFKSTDVINGTPAGVAVDVHGKPIMDRSVPDKPVPFVSDDPDSNSLMKIDGAKPTGLGGNPLSLITHYEYITSDQSGKSAYGIIPASMSLSTIDQNKATGELSVTDVKKVDFSSVGGLWIPCNGSLTPWNTHLSSEEYDADARAYEADPAQTYVSSFTKNYYQDDKKVGNPYAYGYIPEVTVHADHRATVVKHYSMGRFSHELGRVAPDRRTVFFGDDGSNTMMFLYVADKAEDLSAGTLYAAKWIQTSDENGGTANLKWIKLGHATDNEVKAYIDKGIKFSDIFEAADHDTPGFTKIKTYPSGKLEWLKVKPGMEKAAAFLESRRYGAIMGATAEFNKMEGVAVNSKDKKLYVAMSYVEKSMEKDIKGTDASDDIQVKKIKAGVTYEISLEGHQQDKDNNKINSEFVPSLMKGLIVGEDLPKADEKGNTAVVDKVANPDNLSYSESMRTLFIGEDSGMHANNFVWAYNVDTKKLSRILSLPAGAEATGLQSVDHYNGFSYIMSNLQHPGDEMIIPEPLKTEVEGYINQNFDNKRSGLVGYISGLPSLEIKKWKNTNKPDVTLQVAAKANGAKVTWNNKEHTVTVEKGVNKMVLKVGERFVEINGETFELPSEIRVKKGRTTLPADLLDSFFR